MLTLDKEALKRDQIIFRAIHMHVGLKVCLFTPRRGGGDESESAALRVSLSEALEFRFLPVDGAACQSQLSSVTTAAHQSRLLLIRASHYL